MIKARINVNQALRKSRRFLAVHKNAKRMAQNYVLDKAFTATVKGIMAAKGIKRRKDLTSKRGKAGRIRKYHMTAKDDTRPPKLWIGLGAYEMKKELMRIVGWGNNKKYKRFDSRKGGGKHSKPFRTEVGSHSGTFVRYPLPSVRVSASGKTENTKRKNLPIAEVGYFKPRDPANNLNLMPEAKTIGDRETRRAHEKYYKHELNRILKLRGYA